MRGLSKFVKLGFLTLAVAVAASAGATDRSAKVVALKGDARYKLAGGNWQPLKVGDVIPAGSMVQTAAASTLDLLLDGRLETPITSASGGAGLVLPSGRTYIPPTTPPSQNSSVVRLQPDTILGLDKLTTTQTGADEVQETQLDLQKGTIFGTTKRVTGASKYEIKLPNGVAAIRGTTYAVSDDGSVSVLSGTVYITTTKNGTSTTVAVAAGSTFNPVTGLVLPTPPETASSISQIFSGMGYTIYTAPLNYSVDNTTVWVSPITGQTP